MFDLFYKYLVLNKKAVVPGVGTLTIVRQPAQQNFAEKNFEGPSLQVKLNQGNGVVDDKFYSFVSAQQKVDEVEAKRLVEDFSTDLKQQFKSFKEVKWEGIGLITENMFGELQLEPQHVVTNYFPAVTADRIARDTTDNAVYKDNIYVAPEVNDETFEETEEVVSKKQDWWIDAIILALLAIAVIGYYYFQNGTLLH